MAGRQRLIAALAALFGALVLFGLPAASLAAPTQAAGVFGDHAKMAVVTPRVWPINCASKTRFAKVVCHANSGRDRAIARALKAQNTANDACALKPAIEQSTCRDLAAAGYSYKVAIAKAKASRTVMQARCNTRRGAARKSACRVSVANRFAAAVSRASAAKAARVALAVPGAPAAPTASAGDAKATITVAKGTGASPTSFTVTAVQDTTKTCTVTGASGSCDVTGLTNGTAYTFTATASNSYGTSGSSAKSSAVTPHVAAPDVPAAPTAVAGDARATVTVAAGSGGSTPTSFTVTAVEDTTKTCTVTGASGSCDVTGLTNGTQYTFTATASNGGGTSGASAASTPPVTPLAAPAAPASVSAVAGDAQATATVVAPVSTANVDHYRIQVSTDAALFCDTVGIATSCDVTGLTNGTPYAFTATSVNANGLASSATAASTPTVTPLAAPNAPATIVAAGGNGQATITVTAPVAGGGPVASYRIDVATGALGGSTGFCTVNAPALSCNVLLLTNGTAYTFVATAVNANGLASVPTAASNTVTPQAAPAAPQSILSAVPGDARATVTVVAPAVMTYVDHYRIQVSNNAALFCNTVGTATSCDITGLANGSTSYAFTATSVNANGLQSTATAASTPLVMPLAPPTAPAAIAATAGDAQATVTVTAPGSSASPVDHYRMQVSADATKFCVTPDNATLSCNINGLTNNTPYTFTATSVNVNGTSSVPTAPSAPVTPSVLPNAPLAPSATGGATQASITINPNPITAGTIDHFRVQVTDDATKFCVTPNNTTFTCTITGLTPADYTFTSTAIGFFGAVSATSPASNTVTVTA